MVDTDAMTQERYEQEVEQRAKDAVQQTVTQLAVTDRASVLADLDGTVSDIVTNHNWFARSYYDIHLYASIIEHRRTTIEEMPHDDWQHRIAERGDPENGLRAMAQEFFEQDVWNAALAEIDIAATP